MQCNCNIVNILQLITIIKQYLSYNYDYDFKVIYECLISCLIYKYNTRYTQISKNWWWWNVFAYQLLAQLDKTWTDFEYRDNNARTYALISPRVLLRRPFSPYDIEPCSYRKILRLSWLKTFLTFLLFASPSTTVAEY